MLKIKLLHLKSDLATLKSNEGLAALVGLFLLCVPRTTAWEQLEKCMLQVDVAIVANKIAVGVEH